MKKVKISDFADVVTGGTPSTTVKEYWEKGSIPWLNSGELNKKYIFDSRNFITELGLKNSSTRLMPPETVLIALTGATCGLSAITKIEACANQSVTGILPSKNHNSEYLLHYLRTQRQWILDKAWGNAQPHISQKFVKDLIVPLPSLSDQIRIAKILGSVGKIIQQRKQSISLLEEYLKGMFLEMFGDPVNNRKQWEKKKLKELAQEFKYGTNIISSNVKTVHATPILRIPNIVDGEVNYAGLKYSVLDDLEKKKVLLSKGDLLFVRTNGNPNYIGRCAVFNDDIECGYASYLIRVKLKPNSGTNSLFIKYIVSLPSFRKTIVGKAKTTAGNYNINTDGLKDLNFILPPMALQTQFTSIITKTETLKNRYKRSLQELENLYGSLSLLAFKGELIFPNEYKVHPSIQPIAAEPFVVYKDSVSSELNEDELLQLYFILYNISSHSDKREEATLAEVKMEKTCHFAEAKIPELQFNRNPIKQMYGPADFARLYKLHDFAAENSIFYYDRNAQYKKYTEGENFMKYFSKAIAAFKPFAKEVKYLITTFLPVKTEMIDIYATTFAAWNNLLILNKSVSSEAIINEARWHEKKQRFTDAEFKGAIAFLKANNLKPTGAGKLVTFKKE